MALFRYAPGDVISGETFSRASIGTYIDSSKVRQNIATGTKRDGHYIGSARTLLLEPASINTWVPSQTIAVHGLDGATALDNQVTGADGTTSMGKLTEAAVNQRHIVYERTDYVAGGTRITFSFDVRPGTRDWVAIVTNDSSAGTGDKISWFNATTGAWGTINANHTVVATLLSNSCYRVQVTATVASTSTVPYDSIAPSSGDGNYAYLGDVTKYIYVGAVQFEGQAAGCPYGTSQIVTTGASVTRAVDAITWPGIVATGATLHYEYYDLSTGLLVTNGDSPYTSSATIVPPVGRAYTLVEVRAAPLAPRPFFVGQAVNRASTY